MQRLAALVPRLREAVKSQRSNAVRIDVEPKKTQCVGDRPANEQQLQWRLSETLVQQSYARFMKYLLIAMMRVNCTLQDAIPALLLGVALVAGTAGAQSYPSRPVRLIVPFSTGTGMDLLARALADPLGARFGQSVVVENKPGASGTIGSYFVAKSPPDGHTVMITANSFAIVPALYKTLPFNPVDDFSPIGEIALGELALVVHPSLGVASAVELVSLARRSPGRLNYASPGNGTPHHLAMELLKQTTGVDIVHVPYKASAGAVTDVVAGQVPLMVMPVSVALPYAAPRRVRLLAVLGDRRSAQAPDVPTLREAGIEGVDVDLWYGLLVPARTPRHIVERLHQEILVVLTSAEFRDALLVQGLTPKAGTPSAFGAKIKSDLARWRRVVNEAGITAD